MSASPPVLHSSRTLCVSRRDMDTACSRGNARFPPRQQPKSFSIDWILSSGPRMPALDTRVSYTEPEMIMRGALLPTLTNRPFVGVWGSACVYTPQLYHRQFSAYRTTERRINDEHRSVGLTCSPGEFGLKTCRRIRTVFSAEQLQKLEEVFAKQRYMTGSEKVLLASALRLTETQVKVWFQNRRTKWRKSKEVEERPKDRCSDLKLQTFTTKDGEFKSVHRDESPEP